MCVKASRELGDKRLPQWCAIATTCLVTRPSRPRKCARPRATKDRAPNFGQHDPFHPFPTFVHSQSQEEVCRPIGTKATIPTWLGRWTPHSSQLESWAPGGGYPLMVEGESQSVCHLSWQESVRSYVVSSESSRKEEEEEGEFGPILKVLATAPLVKRWAQNGWSSSSFSSLCQIRFLKS